MNENFNGAFAPIGHGCPVVCLGSGANGPWDVLSGRLAARERRIEFGQRIVLVGAPGAAVAVALSVATPGVALAGGLGSALAYALGQGLIDRFARAAADEELSALDAGERVVAGVAGLSGVGAAMLAAHGFGTPAYPWPAAVMHVLLALSLLAWPRVFRIWHGGYVTDHALFKMGCCATRACRLRTH